MSIEDKLSPELASFEARLREHPLEASGVNRDQLMYQAGLAAAAAARKTNWVWPTTSGVLAASVLVLVSLLATKTQELPSEGRHEPVVIATTEPPVSDTGPAISEPNNLPRRKAQNRPILRWTSNSPFFAMRERALRMEFDEPVPVTWSEEEYASEPTTAKQLLQEFLGETS